MSVRKPKRIILWDGEAECVTEQPVFNEAYGVEVDGFLYTSKDVRKLIKFLEKAEQWMKRKEANERG